MIDARRILRDGRTAITDNLSSDREEFAFAVEAGQVPLFVTCTDSSRWSRSAAQSSEVSAKMGSGSKQGQS